MPYLEETTKGRIREKLVVTAPAKVATKDLRFWKRGTKHPSPAHGEINQWIFLRLVLFQMKLLGKRGITVGRGEERRYFELRALGEAAKWSKMELDKFKASRPASFRENTKRGRAYIAATETFLSVYWLFAPSNMGGFPGFWGTIFPEGWMLFNGYPNWFDAEHFEFTFSAGDAEDELNKVTPLWRERIKKIADILGTYA